MYFHSSSFMITTSLVDGLINDFVYHKKSKWKKKNLYPCFKLCIFLVLFFSLMILITTDLPNGIV